MRAWLRISVLIAVALVAACQQRDPSRLGEPGQPIVLVLSPAHGGEAAATRLGELLSRESGLLVTVRVAASPEEAVSLAGSPGVDGGILSLFEYLLARQEYRVEARLQLLRGRGARTYEGALWVRTDGPVRELADLGGRTVAFVDRASTTGYLLAAKLLAERGIKVRPLFTGSHQAAAAALGEGRADAAASFDQDPPSGLTRLAQTGEVPNEPVFFRASFPADKRQRLVRAFIALAASDEGRATLAQIADASGFAEVDDTAYVQVGALLAATKRRLEDVVPGGWQLVNEKNRPASELGPY